MLAKRADKSQLEFASIFLQTKIHMYLNIYNAPKPVKTPVMTATTYHQLKINEAMHILWEGPDLNNLNKQVQHYNFSLTF